MDTRPQSQTSSYAGYSQTYGGFSAPSSNFQAQNINIGTSTHDNPCLRDLRLTDPREDRLEILARKDTLLKDSCRWVCTDPAFLEWWGNEEARVLWIHGDPGKGKTMIMMALVDEVSRRAASQTSRAVSSYFFCQSTNIKTNSATAILRGLIYMLVSEEPRLVRHVRKKFEDAGPRLLEGPSALFSLWTILSEISNDPIIVSVYLIVDALDECDTGLTSLLDLVARTDLAMSRKIKWLVSSRNEPAIGERLGFGEGRQHTSLELNAEHVSHAVRCFLDVKVEELAARKGYIDELKAFVKDYLTKHAEDTFLWVALVCKELDATPLRRTRTAVQKFPAGLKPLYDRMLDQVHSIAKSEDLEFCERVLRAATLSSRPLDLKELVFVAALPEDEFEELNFVQEIVQLCGSFLTVRKDVVYFVHQSAKDYFDAGSDGSIFPRGHARAHADVADRCVEMMSQRLHDDMCGLRAPGTLARDVDESVISTTFSVGLRYACCQWLHHLLRSDFSIANGTDLHDGGTMHVFFQRHLLHWLESLSLLGEIFTAVTGLLELDLALQDINGVGELLRATVSDAKRFLLTFRRGMELAPLQCYSSALLFSPSGSVTRQNYEGVIPAWMELRSAVEESWGASLHALEGHSSSVKSVAFSPDGRTLASGSKDRIVRIWDTATGASLHTLKGHSSSVWSVAFSPDGRTLASRSGDIVRIWDTATGASLHTLEGHSSSVWSVAFSPDGRTQASIVEDGIVEIRDTATGASLHTLGGHLDWVELVAFSPDGRTLASGSHDKTVRIWDTATGASLHTLEGHSSSVMSVAFSPDGRTLASGVEDGIYRIWDTATGASLYTLGGHSDWVELVAFSPDGRTLASGSHDKTVRIWDTATGASLHTLEGHSSSVMSVAFSPDGRTLASGSKDRIVRIWDTATGASLHTLKGHLSSVISLAFSPNGRTLASRVEDGIYRIWDTATGASLHTLKGYSGWDKSVAFSPDGKMVASGSRDKTVRIWDTATGASLYTLGGHLDWVELIAFSPDGKIVASGSHDKTVRIWDTATGASLHTLEGHSSSVMSVAFSPDGRTVASGSDDSMVRIWDISTGGSLHTPKCRLSKVNSIIFSQDGKMVAFGSHDMAVRIWDTATGGSRHTFEGHLKAVNSVAFAQDGKLVASGSNDQTVRIWDATTGASLHTLKGHLDSVNSVVFSRNGKLLASGCNNMTVRIWDIKSGRCLKRLYGVWPLNATSLDEIVSRHEPAWNSIATSASQSAATTVHCEHSSPLGISSDLQWITHDDQKVLWLPHHIRPGKFATRGKFIMLGSGAGGVSLLSLRSQGDGLVMDITQDFPPRRDGC